MNVANTHSQYRKYLPLWQKCRDAREGEEAIKAAGHVYLTPLTGGVDNDEKICNDGYLKRAYFYNATGRTAEALSGLLFVKPPAVKQPKRLEDFVKTVGPDEEPLFQMVQTTANELIDVGRVGVLVDSAPGGDPYVTIYLAEDIINWRVERINGRRKPTLIVLREVVEVVDDGDVFANDTIDLYRVLRLVEASDGSYVYQMQLYQLERTREEDGKPVDVWKSLSTTIPTNKAGKVFDYIPFQFINTNNTTPECNKPPLLDLVNINISHYRTTADLEHGRHFTGLPTPWVAGVEDDVNFRAVTDSDNVVHRVPVSEQKAIYLGSTRVQRFTNPQAKFQFAEFNGQGLSSLEKALEQKEKQMQIVGGRMLEEQKKAQDRSEALKLRMVGDSATLSGVADQLSIGWTSLLQMLADWLLIDDSGISYTVSREFTSFTMDANTMATFMSAVQQGLVPWDDLVAAFQRAGFSPSERPLADTKKLVEAGFPTLPLANSVGDVVNPNTPQGDVGPLAIPVTGVGAASTQ